MKDKSELFNQFKKELKEYRRNGKNDLWRVSFEVMIDEIKEQRLFNL